MKSFLALLPLVVYAPTFQEQPAPTPTTTDEVYPPVRHDTVVHGFSLPDEVKADVVRKALADLSTKDADCTIRYGPMKATARPSKVFVLVEAPAKVEVKDIIKALRKGAVTVEPLAWTCFESSDKTLGRGLGGGMPGMSPRDFILGLSNDLRWVEARGGFVEFFFVPGKLTADEIADRFHKLAQPFGVKDVGEVALERITWTIAGSAEVPLDDKCKKRVEKELAKIHGVEEVVVDIARGTLELKVALADLVRGAPPIAMPGSGDALVGGDAADADAAPVPRMRFDTNLIFTVLDKERLTVTPRAIENAEPERK